MPENTPIDQPVAPQDAAPAAESETPRPLEVILAEAQGKLEDQRQAWLRALADAENARKRAQADVAQARKFAVERFVEDLLPVADSLEAALATEAANAESLRSGIELTLKLLRGALERASVTEVAPSAGERFDPHRHQAMAMVPAEVPPNTVVAVMQKGYCLNDRIVRPAMVTVAKAPEAAPDPIPQVENGGGNPISNQGLDQQSRN
ncbi:MAG: nucleotide exchange factor GrpE [Betaproteobacteria bacterium RIFCSPLOWO2_02_FULL_66_14]|nr:MAG: nucleotide exchange factor GrpE [Betaproteobacteria bacterium RIFCSPLOWO2_02_FULL_66_14]